MLGPSLYIQKKMRVPSWGPYPAHIAQLPSQTFCFFAMIQKDLFIILMYIVYIMYDIVLCDMFSTEDRM